MKNIFHIKDKSVINYALPLFGIIIGCMFLQDFEKQNMQASAAKIVKVFGGKKEVPEKPKIIYSEEIIITQPGDNMHTLFDISTEEAVTIGKQLQFKVDTVGTLIRVMIPVGFRFKLIRFDDGTYEIKKDPTLIIKKRMEIQKIHKRINKKPHRFVAFLLSFSDDFINDSVFFSFFR